MQCYAKIGEVIDHENNKFLKKFSNNNNDLKLHTPDYQKIDSLPG